MYLLSFVLFFFHQSSSLAKKRLIHYTSYDGRKRANSAYLIGCYAVSCTVPVCPTACVSFYGFCYIQCSVVP